MEQTLWVELVRQVPALSVLVFLIIKFLAYLSATQQAEHSRTERVAEALERNTEVLGRVVESLHRRDYP